MGTTQKREVAAAVASSLLSELQKADQIIMAMVNSMTTAHKSKAITAADTSLTEAAALTCRALELTEVEESLCSARGQAEDWPRYTFATPHLPTSGAA